MPATRCEVLGVDYDTVRSWGGSVTQSGTDAIVSLLKDAKADMTIDHVGAGQSATTELCLTTAMFFPELSAETRAKMNGQGFDNIAIPANTWNGQTKESSPWDPPGRAVSASVPDDEVYSLRRPSRGKGSSRGQATLGLFDPPRPTTS